MGEPISPSADELEGLPEGGLAGLIAKGRAQGSLTTGDYAEGVTWLMRRNPIYMSQAQLAKLRRVMPRYSRDVQPLNDRVIRRRQP